MQAVQVHPEQQIPAINLTTDGSGRNGREYAAAMARENQEEEHSVQHGRKEQALPANSVQHGTKEPALPAEAKQGGEQPYHLDPQHATIVVEEAPETYFNWAVYFSSYFKKWKGGLDTALPLPSWADLFWSWLGAFLGILAVSVLNQWVTPEIHIALLVGSFGASAVLVFGMLESKMAQPRNFVCGQILSAIIGITVRVIIPKPWIAAPVGMSLALFAMQMTRTTHPPACLELHFCRLFSLVALALFPFFRKRGRHSAHCQLAARPAQVARLLLRRHCGCGHCRHATNCSGGK